MERNFRHVAEAKNLAFHVDFDRSLPRAFTTDPKRLQQILKNLLSNAFKFTAQGQVAMHVQPAPTGWTPGPSDAAAARRASIAFAVTDTGIGIAPEKQRLIFEAFQQADAGTSRKYGGTGLGLAISRELATLLGGEIRLVSAPGAGQHVHALSAAAPTPGPPRATIVPRHERAVGASADACERCRSSPSRSARRSIADDRESIQPGDTVLLIVEDDPHYARVLLGLARDKGFKGIVANARPAALTLAGSTCRPPSRSTCSCPTCSAGRC